MREQRLGGREWRQVPLARPFRREADHECLCQLGGGLAALLREEPGEPAGLSFRSEAPEHVAASLSREVLAQPRIVHQSQQGCFPRGRVGCQQSGLAVDDGAAIGTGR